MTLKAVTFDKLPGWQDDAQDQALYAFKQSCLEIMRRDEVNHSPSLKPLSKWRNICRRLTKRNRLNVKAARQFFETWFVPYEVAVDGKYEGLFTGYYLPLIRARLKANKQFSTPIYALPNDLVKADLGVLNPRLSGIRVVAQVKNNALIPYPDRAIINRDKMNGQARILMWADNPIDVYFAQVQGSALVDLADGKRVMIGYAGDNGKVYTAIGKILVDNDELDRSEVSMQSIRAWLLKHPEQMEALFNQNASYVFFKILSDYQPLGTEKIPLTPARSLAIDNRYIPLGTPLWLTTTIPDITHPKSTTSFKRLLIAQDTGGAIKGVVRGDIYWGPGKNAAFIAGQMKNVGRYWLLLPK